MQLAFHPSVAADIDRIMAHYEQIGAPHIAERFYAELRSSFLKALAAPRSYAIHSRDLRRVNLERFPHHFLFRIVGNNVRVLVVRHHSRHPSLATTRR
jgi:plasmid stabilization system protein ParE